MTNLKDSLDQEGFALFPFPDALRLEMLQHIETHMKELTSSFLPSLNHSLSLEELAAKIPDSEWSVKMSRAYRIFPLSLSEKIAAWADQSLTRLLQRKRSAVNKVYPLEPKTNVRISPNHLAIYWRCVRPGRPDAGRPHRDASFWVLEFEEGYDPQVPFAFDYLKDCIKIWIPLKGCTPQTTLQIIPGTHIQEIPTIVEETEYGRRPSLSSTWLEAHQDKFISPRALSEGSCILFDMNLVHRGPAHNNQELRISAELCFIVQ